MDIQVDPLTNQQARKFLLPFAISVTEKVYSEAKAALISPVAHKIFGFPWAQSVTVGVDFVVITKQDWVDWEVLEEPLKGLLVEHFKMYNDQPIEENPAPVAPPSPQVPSGESNPKLASPEAQKILKLFADEVNPSLASHGGFAVLHGVEEARAFIEMGGGCKGCAMSYMTLKEGIETAIKQAVPTITEVIDITDHAAGDNPYYSKS